MQLSLGHQLGEGGFGDVYEATDALGRRVAVKIIRSSASVYSSALDHARALARTQHPNVVSIYALDKVTDPETGTQVDCVVMELLEGETLSNRLDRERLTIAEVRQVGEEIIAGLGHIHAQGLAHGDLHADNVMLVGSHAKIIDILYRDSLALLSTASRDVRLRRDLLNLRLMLYDTLLRSESDRANAADFNASLSSDASLQDIRAAFLSVLDPARVEDLELRLEHALQRVRDEGFVDGDQYARALAQETPSHVTFPLLSRLLEQGGVAYKHRLYLRLLWDRLRDAQKLALAQELAARLDQTTPNGSWGAPINMLVAFGADGWRCLSQRSRLRLESVVVNDILAGHFDIYGSNLGNPGALGTYVNPLWSFFTDRDRLVDNIAAQLQTNWYGQNYVGNYLMNLLPLLADTPTRRKKLLDGICEAVRNDAKMIVRGLPSLPPDWQSELSSCITE